MRLMTDVVVEGVQAVIPAPIFRGSGSSASAHRLVSGQECFGSAFAASQVESVSGTGLAGAAGFLGLIALGAGLLERHGYVGSQGQERPRPVTQPVLAQAQLSGGSDRDDDGNDSSGDDSSKGDNGSKPMTPWDFRTSGPPG
ncbi:hypothetical protein [Catenulispora pinisilvae]|uniref:hypothetical protein n=1 Tax=Catenulispora pinisilvae TaxID=2705253 RepID=UPI0018922FA7|nr:hypothetical protein [Catenulispora pinisilvae]